MNAPLDIFYRSLHSRDHLAAWANSRYNSFHDYVPHEWQNEFYIKGTRDAGAYPLVTSLGKFTKRGVENFIRLAPKYESYSQWERTDTLLACELDGVCAFRSATSVLKYLFGISYPDILIVQFEGIYIGDIPESVGGMTGVQVKPINTLNLWPYHKFASLFGPKSGD